MGVSNIISYIGITITLLWVIAWSIVAFASKDGTSASLMAVGVGFALALGTAAAAETTGDWR